MTISIAITLLILFLSIILFISEKIRADIIALMVLIALSISGLVTPTQALAGFSSPAVITVWTMFILSAGLTRTGVAGWLGRRLIKISGNKTTRLLLVIMLITIFLSAFMNNVGVIALLLPVILDISRRNKIPRSKLLMPLAFSTLFGGMITLIGTPANILVNDALLSFNFQELKLFDFAPVGIAVSVAGILYILIFSRWLLPNRNPASEYQHGLHEMEEAFAIEDRLFVLRIPEESRLAGKPIKDSRLGAALGISVIGIVRDEVTILAPDPLSNLEENDRLLVTGRPDKLLSLINSEHLIIEEKNVPIEYITSPNISLVELELNPQSSLIGKTLEDIGFRQKYGANVMAFWRNNKPIRTNLETKPLRQNDLLLIQAKNTDIALIQQTPDFSISETHKAKAYHLNERLNIFSIPEKSSLIGKSLGESHLGDAFGMGVMAIIRNGEKTLMPESEEKIQEGDELIAKGRMKDIDAIESLQELEIDYDAHPGLEDIQSDQIGTVEIMLSPQTTLVGKTLRQIKFREKYGISVLGIWRAGRPRRFNIRDIPLRFGDALLTFGPKDKQVLLADEPDFLILTDEVSPAPHTEKAKMAGVIMLGVVILAGTGVLSIAIASMLGFTLMILTGCLSMNEAYRSIDWRAIFIIAGMLPLGVAMQTSGTAQFLAEQVILLTSAYNGYVQVGGLFLLTALASQFMPNAVITVLMAPIALVTAGQLGFNPQAILILVAIAASSSFLSPVAHPSNILIMGPGGYKFGDFFKFGFLLIPIVLIVTLLVLPLFWPLFG
ncbi:MAG: SLC13 family permease [Chloroflexi bacterium]|jgi:di/tricarboxylate transporter|nr:SLC13 family permease [Chloroflexota bacterium]MBT3668833.1 SLC13 family permease [Chloroflexota bacterium]MBT4004237.1 SLC13 family permease [Chloroflexota bacterium]MBT4306547.1 SLC13 family permease [Chloroflexota bacterium]MBT4533931.1 SLC13 family permease [Chloroflexota bacterium]